MRNRLLVLLLGLVIVLSCSASAHSQAKEPTAPAKAASSSKTPDLSGVWMRDAPPATAAQYWIYELNQEEPPMTPWGLQKFKEAKSSFGAHEYPLEETNDPVVYAAVFRPACLASICTPSLFNSFKPPAKS